MDTSLLETRETKRKTNEKGQGVGLSMTNCGPDIKFEDKRTVKGHLGYQTALGTHGISESGFYFEGELLVSDPPIPTPSFPKSDVRVGFSIETINKETSIGSTHESYALRLSDGAILHNGLVLAKTKGFETGDRFSCFIYLDPPKPPFAAKMLKKFPGVLTNWGGRITFFKNEEALYFVESPTEGIYFPAVSLFMGARCKISLGKETKRLEADGRNYAPYGAISSETRELPLN